MINNNLVSLTMPNLQNVGGGIIVRASPPLPPPPHYLPSSHRPTPHCNASHCSGESGLAGPSPLPQVDPDPANCDLGPLYAGQDLNGFC